MLLISLSQISGYSHVCFQGRFIPVTHRDAENNLVQRLSTGHNWAVCKTSILMCIFPLRLAITSPWICLVKNRI